MTRTTRLATLSAILTGVALIGCARKDTQTAVPRDQKDGRGQTSADEKGFATPETVHLSSAAIAEAGIGTWTVKPVSLEHLLVLNGTVGHDENHLLQVSANVRGRIVSIPVDLGARVAKGDVLATIESVDLGRAREDYIRQLAALRVATLSHERAKALVAAKAISAGEFQAREGDYLSKKAAADAAERALHLLGESQEQVDRMRIRGENQPSHDAQDGANFSLRAPFAGRVIERKVTPGSLFESLQPLLTLADLKTVWVFMQAYEKDLAQLREGVAVTIRTEAYPQEAFKGRVDFLGSVVDTTTRTIKVRATVANPTEKLRPGMFVKAQVDVPQSYEGETVLAVPQSALQTLEDRTMVFIQTEPGSFMRRIVEPGHSFEGFTEVYSGVKTGDVVVTEGCFILKSEFAKATLVEED